MRAPLQIRVCPHEDCGYVAPWTPDAAMYYCPAHGQLLMVVTVERVGLPVQRAD
jgi:hypothetical protein